MTIHHGRGAGVTRREILVRTLQAGAYAAPVVLSSVAPAAHIAAATPAPMLCTQPVTFLQDAILLGVSPGASFTVYAQPSNAATAGAIGTFAADARGVAMGVFALPPVDTSVVTSVMLSVYLAGTAPPDPAAATFTSRLVMGLACRAGSARATAAMLAKVVQEPTTAACTSGTLNQWQELIDVNVINATPGALYDVYLQAANGVGGAVKAGTMLVNGQGNGGAILSVTVGTTGGAPTGVTVSAVPAGAPPTPATFITPAAPTGDVTTSGLFTLSCAGVVTGASVTGPRLLAVH
jgi:hypothetical protein